MKAGANTTDRNAIARMAKQGEDAEYISQSLQIELDVVKAFLPKQKEVKGKNKLADKLAK